MKFNLQYAKLLSQKFLNIDDDIIPEIEMCLEREGDKVSLPFEVDGFEIKFNSDGFSNSNDIGNGNGFGDGDGISNHYGDGVGGGNGDGYSCVRNGDGYGNGYNSNYNYCDIYYNKYSDNYYINDTKPDGNGIGTGSLY